MIRLWSVVFLLTVVNGEISCPPYTEIPFCSCFVLDDQLHIQCSGNDIQTLQKSLYVLNGPVKSFSVYDLDSKATILPNQLTDNVTSPILQFSLSHSSLEDLGEWSLRGLAKSLENLSIVSARIKFIPQTTLSTLKRLKTLDFEGNQIQELGPYSFHNILLQKLNLKGNQLENISEHAFWGLEETLMDIDMSENKLRSFPSPALTRLRLLSSLNLAWNELSEMSNPNGVGDWPLLKYLNLNSNYLKELKAGSFQGMGNLRSLSLHLNSLELVSQDAFSGLNFLESLDLSHNKLRDLESLLFKSTPRIVTLDLSNNHIHGIHESQFNDLQSLRELFLNGNNLLSLSGPLFSGSPALSVIYLQQNGLRLVEAGIFAQLQNLTEVRLSDNFLKVLPQDLFLFNSNLNSISLDGNLLEKIVPGTFTNCNLLRELRLQNNQISAILYGVLNVIPQVEEVYLENNKLNLIEGLENLQNLRHISLSRNSLQELTNQSLPPSDLNSLSIGHNQITIIRDYTFQNSSNLGILFLGNNHIESIGSRTLIGLRNLERLYLLKNNITSISPDAFFNSIPGIQFIDLSFNQLSSIDSKIFSSLVNLEEVNLAHNRISHLETGAFGNLRNLRILDLSHNRLSRIEYSMTFELSGIEILKLGGNQLNEFSLGRKNGPIRIKELDLRDNALSSGNLRQLEIPKLELLQISGNNLTDLDEETFTGFPGLSFLEAEKCHLASLPTDLFRRNPNLAVLKLSDNSLSWIPDTLFMSDAPKEISGRLTTTILPLRELHLRHNKFRNFPYKPLSNLSYLSTLSLSGNRINSIEISRIKLPRLKQLDLNDNRLSKISGPSLSKSMPLLEVVDFGENNISRINDEFLKNVTLTQINFGGNALSKIPYAFSNTFMTNSYVLNMSGNPLINFYTENHSDVDFSVMDLYLADTNVSILNSEEFRIYPKLHRLVIKRNPIKIIPTNAFSPLINLNLLDLSDNEIENFKHDSFLGLTQLKYLNLSNNRIKSLSSFHPHLQGLQDLDLSYNQLSTLIPGALTHLSSLLYLRLRGNWITIVPTELLQPLLRLSVLDLSHNFIENMQEALLTHLEPRITALKLEENPLSCECESKEFWTWLRSHPKIFGSSPVGPGEPNFICERPESVRGRLILDINLPSNCVSPAILKLNIQEVRPSSALISWQGRNNSNMHSYVIAYHALNHNDVVRTRPLTATSGFHLLPDLQSDTPYLVCIVGLSNDSNGSNASSSSFPTLKSLKSTGDLVEDSTFSKCKQIRTLGYEDNEKVSLIHRRLGVLVGAIVGFVVFVIFITTLACVKYKNRRRFRQQQGGKIEHSVGEAVSTSNAVGTLGGYHQGPSNNHSYQHAHIRPNGNGATMSPPRHLSPDFLNYRHYTISNENGHHPPELERL